VLHSALLFGLLTGMRSGEICGLMAEDITHKGNLGRFIQISQTLSGSSSQKQLNGKYRFIKP
jgi:integrase